MVVVSLGGAVLTALLCFHAVLEPCSAFSSQPTLLFPAPGTSWHSPFSKSILSLNAVKDKKGAGGDQRGVSVNRRTKQGGLFFVAEPPTPPTAKASRKKKDETTTDEEPDDQETDGTGLKAAAAAAGTTLAAARTATTISGGIAATTVSVTSGSTSVGTTVSTLGAARSATTLVSTVAATTASVTSGTTTGTVASSGLMGARIGSTIASGVGASSVTAVSGSSTVGTVAVGPGMAGARAATSLVGVSAIASGSGTSSTTTAAGSLVGARVGSGVGAAVAGKSVSGLAVSGKVGVTTRAIPYFATAASSGATIKGGAAAATRLAGAGAAVLASGDIDALSGGAIAIDSTTGAAVGFGDALAGAASEMLGDASTFVGDAIMDGVSTVGSAVADAAIGVATDAAIGTGTAWGVWDGLHRVLPSWFFTGGAAVLGSEIAFALFALVFASGIWGEKEVEAQELGEPVGIPKGSAPSVVTQSDAVNSGAAGSGVRIELMPKDRYPTKGLSDMEPAPSTDISGIEETKLSTFTQLKKASPRVSMKDIDTSEVLADVEMALQAADEALQRHLGQEQSQFTGDTAVKIDEIEDFRGEDAAMVVCQQGENSASRNRSVNIGSEADTLSHLAMPPQEEFDRRELAQRKLLEARIRYEIRYLP